MRLLLAYFCLVAVVLSQVVDIEPPAAEHSDLILDWTHPFHYTVPHLDLLKGLEEEHPDLDAEKRQKIQEIKTVIKNLATQLMKEEMKLNRLKAEVRALKSDFFWFFNDATRMKVDEAQLKVNDQQRVIENLVDDIMVEWKRLKPLYGLYSKMFLSEALGFVPQIWRVGVDVFATFLELGLISLLLFGSITGFMLSLFATIGFSFFPAIIAFATFMVNTYWVFKLPFIMIQYSPTISEFLSVYFSFVGILIGITYLTFRFLFPDTFSVKYSSETLRS
jgi:hypothetical protein